MVLLLRLSELATIIQVELVHVNTVCYSTHMLAGSDSFSFLTPPSQPVVLNWAALRYTNLKSRSHLAGFQSLGTFLGNVCWTLFSNTMKLVGNVFLGVSINLPSLIIKGV